ncbi:MAG: thiamine pyrophosphate-binding protein, partial [Proteobacteria bacterium]|nr:thiamine pyrophosphate-binding protein [Pseudomonadota bacterium]
CIPMLCLSSDIGLVSVEQGSLTDIDQEALMKPITKWNQKIKAGSKIPYLFSKAFRMATGGVPGAVHLALPENILEDEVNFTEEELKGSLATGHNAPFRYGPCDTDLTLVADMLIKAKRPVILSGGGVHSSNAHEQLATLVETFHLPLATSINGKGAISELSDYSIGVVGANGGSIEGLQIIQKADFVLALGSKLNNVTTIGKTLFNDTCKIAQVDIGENLLDANIRTNVAIMSDIKTFLVKLITEIKGKGLEDASRLGTWNEFVCQKMLEKRNRIQKDVEKEEDLVTPAYFFHMLWNLTDEDTYFVADAGTPTPYLASYFRQKKAGRQTVLPRAHGSLGYALPASMGVQVAKPGHKVIALHGDASFAMAAGELETAVRCNLPIVFINFQNYAYGWIKTIQKLYFDETYFAVDFGKSIDVEKVAIGFGLKAKTVYNNSQVEEKLNWALNQDGPVMLNLMIEPPTKTIPPVLKWEKDAAKPADKRIKLTY